VKTARLLPLLLWTFSGTALAEWRLSLAGSGTRLDYRENLRTGWRYETSLTLGVRLLDRWELDAGYSLERRTADQQKRADEDVSGAVFDQHTGSGFAGARYTLTEHLYPSLRYTYRAGDVTSTTQPNLPIYLGSSAIAFDPALGGGAIAYKLHAITHVINAGLTQVLGRNASINFSIERRISHGDNDLNYYGTVYQAVFMYEF
jgi:hypothetical protein